MTSIFYEGLAKQHLLTYNIFLWFAYYYFVNIFCQILPFEGLGPDEVTPATDFTGIGIGSGTGIGNGMKNGSGRIIVGGGILIIVLGPALGSFKIDALGGEALEALGADVA